MESGIAPGSAYVADLKARQGWRKEGKGKQIVGAIGLMYEDENVSEQDVGETGDGREGIAIGLEGLEMTGIVS